ncbi:hypothetical protein [Sediminicola luteus]|uniref:Uncharacterized protein n=1 Tax=Sediminicola luteus TaxID=319238 RepID=A0A2A4G756_9FLAO|nr:hypothetical protein [Sediminicola luteus]PCE63784.1 hypothetical protein B7P33_10960 [Sediminicola luteus]
MEFIQHSLNWVKGEITEAWIMAFFGALLICCSALLWRYGQTPYTKALVIPLLLVGLLPCLMGIYGALNNQKNIANYEKRWQDNKQQFVLEERERVQGFDEIFKYSYPAAFLLTIGGAILFFVLGTANGKAISLALMILGVMAYLIDYFAAERAAIYLEHIHSALQLTIS